MFNLKNKEIEWRNSKISNENLGTKIKPQEKYLRYDTRLKILMN